MSRRNRGARTQEKAAGPVTVGQPDISGQPKGTMNVHNLFCPTCGGDDVILVRDRKHPLGCISEKACPECAVWTREHLTISDEKLLRDIRSGIGTTEMERVEFWREIERLCRRYEALVERVRKETE